MVKTKGDKVKAELTKEKLRERLVKQKLTLNQVAQQYGVSKSFISRLVKLHKIDIVKERKCFEEFNSNGKRIKSIVDGTYGSLNTTKRFKK